MDDILPKSRKYRQNQSMATYHIQRPWHWVPGILFEENEAVGWR
jgi:hypothetical protein